MQLAPLGLGLRYSCISANPILFITCAPHCTPHTLPPPVVCVCVCGATLSLSCGGGRAPLPRLESTRSVDASVPPHTAACCRVRTAARRNGSAPVSLAVRRQITQCNWVSRKRTGALPVRGQRERVRRAMAGCASVADGSRIARAERAIRTSRRRVCAQDVRTHTDTHLCLMSGEATARI